MGEKIHPFMDIKNRKFECSLCLDDPRGQCIGAAFYDNVQLWIFQQCPDCENGKHTETAYVVDLKTGESEELDLPV